MRVASLVALGALIAGLGLAQATPLACGAACVVEASTLAYLVPVVEIAPGGSVRWESADVTHIQVDGILLGAGSCVDLADSPFAASPAVTFAVTGGVLTAAEGANTPAECTTAVPLPDGTFILPYFCSVHPTMRGAIVVTSH